MKLFLLLVAIYSLIFYQSYKKEKLRIDDSGTKKETPAKDYRITDNNKDFQNAVLLYRNDYSVYWAPVKKQPILRRLAFY
jgi:PHD/YefM family antitoxin component YafN of YafNO toxin-antitoxin module